MHSLEEATGIVEAFVSHAVLARASATSGGSTCSLQYERTGMPPPLPPDQIPEPG